MKADISKITQTILALELGVNERWNKGDVDGVLDLYSEDVTYFDPITETRLEGHQAMEVYFRQFFEGKLNILRNEIPNPQVIVSDGGDFAVLNYNLVNIVHASSGGHAELDGLSSHDKIHRLQNLLVFLTTGLAGAGTTLFHNFNQKGTHNEPHRHRQDLHQGSADR